MLRTLHERGEAHRIRSAVGSAELDVHAVAMVSGVEVHRFEQRGGVGGYRNHLFELRLVGTDCRRLPPSPVAGQHRRQQLARGLGIRHHRFGDSGSESALEPGQQLHPRQAVESEVPVERAVQGDSFTPPQVRMKLGDDLAHRFDERLLVHSARRGRFPPIGHASPFHRSGPAAARASNACTASLADRLAGHDRPDLLANRHLDTEASCK